MDNELVVNLLDNIFGRHRSHNKNSGQLTYSCPVCSYEIKGSDKLDEKYNLEINYKLKVGKCWSCCDTHDTHGSLHKLIKQFGTKRQLKTFELLIPDDFTPREDKVYKKVELPKEFIPFKNIREGLKMTHHYKSAMGYLKKRNITDEMIIKYNIGFCYEGEYANRIIIPSYDKEGEVNFFTGRSYEFKPKLKYKNPEAQKEIILFNESLISWTKPIYIVEGPFDSIFLPNSIAMLGKSMSELLFRTLYEKAIKIIIVLDGDAYNNSVKLYEKLNGGKLFGRVWLTKLPKDKDIADLCGNLSDYPPFQLD